ncbi:hypothetical protein TMatcc_002351 [Talaromyces marneffei ATCC 18224]
MPIAIQQHHSVAVEQISIKGAHQAAAYRRAFRPMFARVVAVDGPSTSWPGRLAMKRNPPGPILA